MPKVLDISDTESLSDAEDGMRKVEALEFEIGAGVAGTRHIGDTIASSSGANLRSSFIGMGFSPSLINQVIKEKGDEDADLLLDTLFEYSAQQKLNSESSDSSGLLLHESRNGKNPLRCDAESISEQASHLPKSTSSDSLDSLLDDDKEVEAVTAAVDLLPKQELDVDEDLGLDKRASLLMMNFTAAEVDFAINKLGKSAPINELVDFISAAQIAENENYEDSPTYDYVEKNEEANTEALFGTMEKTLQLLDMGFNEHEVSLAIEKLGSEVPITELANWICSSQMGESCLPNAKKASLSSRVKYSSSLNGSWYHMKGVPSDMFTVKTEDFENDYASRSGSVSLGDMYEGINPKPEYNDSSNSSMKDFNLDEIKGKRPKEELEDDFSALNGLIWKKKSKMLSIGSSPSSFRKNSNDRLGMRNPSHPTSGRGMDKMVSGPPYFLYGNIVNLSADNWQKLSQFLYAIQPEFVNTQFFSALNRKEGYIHNLPTEDRFTIQPKSPPTIGEAMPDTKKWWPPWDTRKQLNCITSETAGTSQICSQLGKMLKETGGALSGEQQTKVLYYCRTMNLVWVSPQKLAPIEPEHLERILGYPIHHTRNPDMSLVDRLESLRNCFQTDALGYHLSVLKPLFPGGITVLSLYSGIGGAEVTLHRLGIYLKAVVSVESSELRRKVLRRWWQSTDQTGELVQIEDIQKLTSSKLEYLMRKFGGFDIVICQNPCTYDEKGSKVIPGSSDVAGLDFTLYHEFVRVLQRVRNMTGRISLAE